MNVRDEAREFLDDMLPSNASIILCRGAVNTERKRDMGLRKVIGEIIKWRKILVTFSLTI